MTIYTREVSPIPLASYPSIEGVGELVQTMRDEKEKTNKPVKTTTELLAALSVLPFEIAEAPKSTL